MKWKFEVKCWIIILITQRVSDLKRMPFCSRSIFSFPDTASFLMWYLGPVSVVIHLYISLCLSLPPSLSLSLHLSGLMQSTSTSAGPLHARLLQLQHRGRVARGHQDGPVQRDICRSRLHHLRGRLPDDHGVRNTCFLWPVPKSTQTLSGTFVQRSSSRLYIMVNTLLLDCKI